jgi:hypothetical protein
VREARGLGVMCGDGKQGEMLYGEDVVIESISIACCVLQRSWCVSVDGGWNSVSEDVAVALDGGVRY